MSIKTVLGAACVRFIRAYVCVVRPPSLSGFKYCVHIPLRLTAHKCAYVRACVRACGRRSVRALSFSSYAVWAAAASAAAADAALSHASGRERNTMLTITKETRATCAR